MTRFLKSTLSIIALLLVCVMAFASCANEEALKESINKVQTDANKAQTDANKAQTDANNAQNSANQAQNSANNAQSSADKAQDSADKAQNSANNAQNSANQAQNSANNAQNSADKAQTDAATALAEAKKALAEATATLQAAIDTKATPADIAAEVAKLTAAIDAAKTIASTADVALKAELLGAIDTAKAAVKLEAENIARALDAAYTELINSKADAAEVAAALADLKDLIDAVDAAADGAINTYLFTDLTKVVVAERIALNARVAALKATGLYTAAQVAAIDAAAFEADTYILRATSIDVIDDAKAAFELVVKNFNMAVDKLYYDLLDFDVKTATIEEAHDLFHSASTLYKEDSTDFRTLLTNYYDGSNLFLIAANNYVAVITPVISELGTRYLVYPEHEVGAQDKLDLEAARAALNTMNTDFSDELTLLVGTDYSADLDANKVAALETAIANFVANEERMTLLASAKTDAEALRTDRFATIVLDQATIDAIQGWQKAVVDWETKYVPAVANATEETTERRNLTLALAADARAAMELDLDDLNALIENYKKTAFEGFQQAVSYFYDSDAPAQTIKDLAGKELDFSKITLASWSVLSEAWNYAQEWKKTNILDLKNIYAPDEKTPSVSEKEITQLWVKYQEIAAQARQDWADLNEVPADLTVDNITIYEDRVTKALTWFEKAYILKDNGAIVWDTVAGVNAYNLYRPTDGQPDVIVTEADYNRLVELNNKFREMVNARNEAAKAIRDGVANLPAIITLAEWENVYDLAEKREAYMALDVNGQNTYDQNSDLNDTNGRDFYIDTTTLTKLGDALNKLESIRDELLDLYNALVAMPEIPTYVDYSVYPFFNDTDNKQVDFETALGNLKAAFKAFMDENNNGETFTKEIKISDDVVLTQAVVSDAKTAILEARKTIAKEAIYKAMKDLRDAEAKLTVDAAEGYRNEFFNTEITQSAYETLITALENAIAAKYDTDFEIADADVADAREAVVDAKALVTTSKINVEYNDMVDALKALDAIEVRDDDDYEAATPFIAADLEDDFADAIAALKQAIADFKAVGGLDADAADFNTAVTTAEALEVKNNVYKEYQKVKAAYNALAGLDVRNDNDFDATIPFIADQADFESKIADLESALTAFRGVTGSDAVSLTKYDDAIVAANVLVAKNEIYLAYTTFKAASVNSVYPYFNNEADRNAYETALNALIAKVEAFYTVDGIVEGDVAGIEAIIDAAEIKIEKYDHFEANYTVKYNAAVALVEANVTDPDQLAAAKYELATVLDRYHDEVPVMDIEDAFYFNNFIGSLNSVLATYNLSIA